ncbi:MAG: glycosyltransferase [Candidatus Omnitrophica bacterium]|nr:glycosyltransferase [Candidatus Omnitrophota bacterium]
MNDCRVVVLNFNGEALLKRCLPSILEAACRSRYRCVVTVLDNQSSDQSRKVVLENFPAAEFVVCPENKILCSYNDYLRRVDEPFAILLNNDIFVEPGFIDPLLDALAKDPGIFFAASKTFGEDQKTYLGSLSKIGFSRGLVWATSLFAGHEKKIDRSGRTMLCGSGAFRREIFCALGGYDELYLPGTVEDLDLCYRAWRQGWKGIYCPESVIYHIGQVSFKKRFGSSGLRRMNRRNLYLFVWKNIQSRRFLSAHLVFLPLQLAKYFLMGQWDFLAGFFEAILRLPQAIQRRRRNQGMVFVLTDEEVFGLSAAI